MNAQKLLWRGIWKTSQLQYRFMALNTWMMTHLRLLFCMQKFPLLMDQAGENSQLSSGLFAFKCGCFYRLQSLVDWMVEQFTSARLMQQQHSSVQRETGDVKLHVTLMNTKFQKRQQSKEIESNGRQRLVFKESFDATQILQVSSILTPDHQPISSLDYTAIKRLLHCYKRCYCTCLLHCWPKWEPQEAIQAIPKGAGTRKS